jgi:hypothetical protein
VLRRIYGPKRDDATGGWEKLHLHNEESHNSHSSPNMLQSIRLRWTMYVACVRKGKCTPCFFKGNLKKIDYRNLDLGRDNIKINYIDLGWVGVNSFDSEWGSAAGSYKHGIECSGSINFWNFLSG